MRLANILLVLAAVGRFCPSIGWADETAGTDGSPLLEVNYSASAPLIDGDSSDPVWKQAAADSAFHEVGKPGVSSSITTVRALYDERSLYLLFTCRGKPTSELHASTILRDGSIAEVDDDVEFFFFPGAQDSLYVQLATNPIGAKYDIQSSQRDYYKDFSWKVSPGWSEDRWIVELEIPLRQFADGVKAGEVWKANFARHFRTASDSVRQLSWGPVVQMLFEPGNFGRMRFEKTVSFQDAKWEVDLTADESQAIDNLGRLKGKATYQPLWNYLDVVLSVRSPSRPFGVLRSRALEFIREYPDSSGALGLALRTIYPAAAGYQIDPDTLEATLRQLESSLHVDRSRRDLISLAVGQYDNETGRIDKWIEIYRKISRQDTPPLAATAAYLLLAQTRFPHPDSKESMSLTKDALSIYSDLAIRGSTPVYLREGLSWLYPTATREGVYSKYYQILRTMGKTSPEQVMSLCRSLLSAGDLPEEATSVLMKTEFEQYANREGPYYSTQKADSLIVGLNSIDEKYGQMQLNALLRARILDLDAAYTSMGPDSVPAAIRSAAALRKHYKGLNPIDFVFALAYETADSLDKSIEYLENYQRSLGERWQRTGPIARYLSELKYRRENRSNPNYANVPRDSFRFIYRVQGFRGPLDFLDVSSDGRAVLYPGVPDSLDPRGRIATTVPTRVDSPAVAFRLSAEEVDSIYALLTHYGFLRYRLKYMEPCYQCGNSELTLITPWNMRTVHLEGLSPDKPQSQLNKQISSILGKYLDPLYDLRSDWRGLSRYFFLWGEYNTPGRSAGKRLDALMELLAIEPMRSSWENKAWYLDPLSRLGQTTGRESDVDAAIGLKYFNSVFQWRSYVRERLPKADADEIAKARMYLQKAAGETDRDRLREWYAFLDDFAFKYTEHADLLDREAADLKDRGSQAEARVLLIWLACAQGDLASARSLYASLLASKAEKESKFESTLRLALFSMDSDHPDSAMEYLDRIDEDYRGLLADRREHPIRRLDEYTGIDLALDRARTLVRSGNLSEAASLVQPIDEAAVPPDRRNDYEAILQLASHREIPSEFKMSDLKTYFQVLSALSRSGLYDLNAQWSIWLLANIDDPKLRSQIISLLMNSFKARDVWDTLEADMARTLLEDYRLDPSWKSIDLTERVLEKVIDRGTEDDVKKFYHDEILPYPLRLTRITTLNRLADYFEERAIPDEHRQVLQKIRREIRQSEASSPMAVLVLAKSTLDLAELDWADVDRRPEASALVDSLVADLRTMSHEAYPYVFASVAEWKFGHEGWDALVEFVRPLGDSLIQAEKGLQQSVYRPPFIPDTPIPSPLLALRCIVEQGGLNRPGNDLFELLAVNPDDADPAVKSLKTSPRRLGLSCDQAQLLNWRGASFAAIVEQFNRQVR